MWQELIDEIRSGDGGLCLPERFESLLGGKENLNWAFHYLDKTSFKNSYHQQNLAAIKKGSFSQLPQEYWQQTIAKFCDFLCLMTFGQSIFDLVAKAESGDDNALFQVVQIDKTTLYAIPKFRQRLAQVQLTSDKAFMSNLSKAIKSPSLGNKIKYPLLMLLFAMLDDDDVLDMPLDDLLDLCEQVGVYGAAHGVEDRDSLRKRRSYYLKNSGRQTAI